MEPRSLDAVSALIARWVYGTGVRRLKGPPRIFLLTGPVVATAEVTATEILRAVASPDDDGVAEEDLTQSDIVPIPTAARSAFFRKRTAMAQAAADRKLVARQAEIDAKRPQADAPPPKTPEPAPTHDLRRATVLEPWQADPDLTIRRTVRAPDPWSIMPSRTLRGAGLRHLQHRGDPLETPETLEERVAREGPDDAAPTTTVALWNLLIVPTQPAFRASDQGVKALVLYLDRSQLLRSPTVSTLEEFVGHPLHSSEEHWKRRLHGGDEDAAAQLISLNPGVFSHQIFYEGAAPTGGPLIMEAHIGHGTKSKVVPFGPSDRAAAFWLALIGCRYDHVSRGFLERMHSILYLRPVVFAVPYTPDTPTLGP